MLASSRQLILKNQSLKINRKSENLYKTLYNTEFHLTLIESYTALIEDHNALIESYTALIEGHNALIKCHQSLLESNKT